jgi:hypothetical protein
MKMRGIYYLLEHGNGLAGVDEPLEVTLDILDGVQHGGGGVEGAGELAVLTGGDLHGGLQKWHDDASGKVSIKC